MKVWQILYFPQVLAGGLVLISFSYCIWYYFYINSLTAGYILNPKGWCILSISENKQKHTEETFMKNDTLSYMCSWKNRSLLKKTRNAF